MGEESEGGSVCVWTCVYVACGRVERCACGFGKVVREPTSQCVIG